MPTNMRSLVAGFFLSFLVGLTAIAFIPQPVMADDYFNQGMALYNQKKFSAALPYFEESYRTTPWDSKACYYKALCLHQMKDYPRALAAYKVLVKNFPATSAAGLAKGAITQLSALVGGGAPAVASAGRTSSAGTPSAAAEEKRFELPFSWEPGGKGISVAVEVNGRNASVIYDSSRSDFFIPSKSDLERMGVQVPVDPDEANYSGTNRVINAVPKEFDVTLEKVKAGKLEKTRVQAKYQDLGEGKPIIGRGFFSGWTATQDNGRRVLIFQKQ